MNRAAELKHNAVAVVVAIVLVAALILTGAYA